MITSVGGPGTPRVAFGALNWPFLAQTERFTNLQSWVWRGLQSTYEGDLFTGLSVGGGRVLPGMKREEYLFENILCLSFFFLKMTFELKFKLNNL